MSKKLELLFPAGNLEKLKYAIAYGVSFNEVDVTNDPDMFMKIYEKSHMRTVPQIFAGDECLGGYDAIAALHQEGQLVAKLGL